MIECIRDGDDGDSLSCIAEHLRAGHHYYIVVCILGDGRLERWFVRLSERFAEIHTHIREVLDDDGVVLCRKFAYGLEFLLCEVEPGRIVRA